MDLNYFKKEYSKWINIIVDQDITISDLNDNPNFLIQAIWFRQEHPEYLLSELGLYRGNKKIKNITAPEPAEFNPECIIFFRDFFKIIMSELDLSLSEIENFFLGNNKKSLITAIPHLKENEEFLDGENYFFLFNKVTPKTLTDLLRSIRLFIGKNWMEASDEMLSDDADWVDGLEITDYVKKNMGDLRPYQKEAVRCVTEAIKSYSATDGMLYLKVPTGGGKTRIASEAILNILNTTKNLSGKNKQKKFIWLAPNWILICQAYEALISVVGEYGTSVRRIGGNIHYDAIAKIKSYEDCPDGKIFLTTIHTWSHRSIEFTDKRENLVVIIDEAHWGINQSMIRGVRDFCIGKKRQANKIKFPVPMLGLTATPREQDHMNSKVAYEITFAELVQQGYLVRPIVRNIPTEFTWDPILRNGEIDSGSLKKLDNIHRNKKILDVVVGALRQEQGKAKAGLLFAVNQEHAEKLYNEFTAKGLACRVIHDQIPVDEREEILGLFGNGRINLLINVSMLTQGFDSPRITEVFLARPSTSEWLISQMIGRGARLMKGKDHFNVYDFHDILDEDIAHQIFHAKNNVFGGRLVDFSQASDGKRKRNKIQAPGENPKWETFNETDKFFSLFNGLHFVSNQTFGVELEISSPEFVPKFDSALWQSGANILIHAIASAVGEDCVYLEGLPYHGSADAGADGLWRVEYDSSAGWEVISPKLAGLEDLKELLKVTACLEATVESNEIFHINYKCGFHLTLATWLDDAEKRLRLLAMVTRLEPALFTLVAPSRLLGFNAETGEYDKTSKNQYCIPLSSKDHRNDVNHMVNECFTSLDHDYRYFSVNLTKMQDLPHLIEVRMHNGTVDAKKIIPWLSLWMSIINTANNYGSTKISRTQIFEKANKNDDLILQLEKEGIDVTESLKSFIRARREVLLQNWNMALPDYIFSWQD